MSFYVVLIVLVFFNYGCASETKPQVLYPLVLKDCGVKISEDVYNKFDYFKSSHNFNSRAILTLDEVTLLEWKTLCKPLTEIDLKKYFKSIDLEGLCALKSHYDYLQLDDVNINTILSYVILKKALPKGTIGFFKRSIASKIFYSDDQETYYQQRCFRALYLNFDSTEGQTFSEKCNKEFQNDLLAQFQEFVDYCALLWQKKDIEINKNIIDVSRVLHYVYYVEELPQQDSKTQVHLEKASDKQRVKSDESRRYRINEDCVKDKRGYLKKKIFSHTTVLDLSFVMVSSVVRERFRTMNDRINIDDYFGSFIDETASRLSVKKVRYFCTKNLELLRIRDSCSNICSVEWIGDNVELINLLKDISWKGLFWNNASLDPSFNTFNPIQTIIIHQEDDQQVQWTIKKEYCKEKINFLKYALFQSRWMEMIIKPLFLIHHFGIVGLSTALYVLLDGVPRVVNSCGIVFDVQFVSNARQFAGELFERHTITRLIMLSFVPYLSSNNYNFPCCGTALECFRTFILLVDYLYYFYALSRGEFAHCSPWYDRIYMILMGLACTLTLYTAIEDRKEIMNELKQGWRLFWYSQCPQVIIKKEQNI